jgi:hypothetical protein
MTVGSMDVRDTRKLYSFLFINGRWNGRGYKKAVLFDRW